MKEIKSSGIRKLRTLEDWGNPKFNTEIACFLLPSPPPPFSLTFLARCRKVLSYSSFLDFEKSNVVAKRFIK